MPVTERLGRLGLPPAGWAFLALLFPGLWLLRMACAVWSGSSLFVDEAQYWDWSRHLAWGYFSKPPVLPVLINISTTMGGEGPVGVRWLVQAMWGLMPLMLWRLGFEMQRDTQTPLNSPHAVGVWAAALATATLVFGVLGQVATTDGPLIFCWVLQMWLMWRALQQPANRVRWLVLGLVLALGVLSKYTMAASLATWLIMLMRQPQWPVLRGMLLAGVVAVLCWLPHLAWNHANDWPTLKHTADLLAGAAAGDNAKLLVWTERALAYLAGQLLIAGPVVLFMAWRGFQQRAVSTSSTPNNTSAAWAWHFSWPLWLVGAWQALQGNAQVNWPAPALMGACLVVAWWLASRPTSWTWRGPMVVVLSSSLLSAVISLGGDWRTRFGLAPQAEPWALWARAQGWDESFAALQPLVAAHPDARLVALDRTVIAHASYAWRDQGWRPQSWQRTPYPDHHYDLTHRFTPDGSQPKVLLVLQGPLPAFVNQSFGKTTELHALKGVGKDLHLWLLEQPLP
jgi:4-amino-4-deoxy-L-arabinose transferase-like glycosyltransferase